MMCYYTLPLGCYRFFFFLNLSEEHSASADMNSCMQWFRMETVLLYGCGCINISNQLLLLFATRFSTDKLYLLLKYHVLEMLLYYRGLIKAY